MPLRRLLLVVVLSLTMLPCLLMVPMRLLLAFRQK